MKRWMAALLALATGTCAAALPGTTMPQNFEPTFYSYDLPYFADAIAIGDLTGDGLDDVVVATSNRLRDEEPDRSVYLFVQQADRLLQVPWRYEYSARGDSLGLGLADFNGDGRLDIAISHLEGLTLMLNTGNPGDRFVIKRYPGDAKRALTIADVDLDGRPDIVTLNYTDSYTNRNQIQVHYGDGAGGIRAMAPLPLAGIFGFVRFVDMNRDRLPDLVVSSVFDNAIQVHYRKADGSYNTTPVRIGYYAASFAIGDFNHDGRPDVTAHYDSGDYRALYFQLANGQFAPIARTPGYSHEGPIVAADLNGDGRDDVMHVARGIGALYSNMQGNTGMEEQALDFLPMESSLNYANGLAVGDLNHDGCPDAAAAIDNFGLVWLYGNTCPERTDLAVAVGFDASAVTVRLANVSRGLTPVAAPVVEIDLELTAPATLQLGTLPADCTVLEQAPQRTRVQCSAEQLAYGAQTQLSLPLQIASTEASSAMVSVTAKTDTPELSLNNNRAGKRIAVAVTATASAASLVAPRRTDATVRRKRTNQTEPRR